MSLTIAVDFDGCIADQRGPALVPRPGALDALRLLVEAGHRLILHSCRLNMLDERPAEADLEDEARAYWATGGAPAPLVSAWDRQTELLRFLATFRIRGLFAVLWQTPGKPLADLYLDDKSEAPDWLTVVPELTGRQVPVGTRRIEHE